MLPGQIRNERPDCRPRSLAESGLRRIEVLRSLSSPLIRWIEASGAETGPLFRSFTRHGKIQGRPSGFAVAAIVKRPRQTIFPPPSFPLRLAAACKFRIAANQTVIFAEIGNRLWEIHHANGRNVDKLIDVRFGSSAPSLYNVALQYVGIRLL
jgi:hypothetical protein